MGWAGPIGKLPLDWGAWLPPSSPPQPARRESRTRVVVPENRESPFKNKKSPFSQPWWRIPAVPALEKLRQEDGCEVNTYVGYCLKTFYIKKISPATHWLPCQAWKTTRPRACFRHR